VKLCVVDLELNSPEYGGQIIQVGAVTLDTATGDIDFARGSGFARYVEIDTALDPAIVTLTGISDSMLKGEGDPIPLVLEEFWNYVGNKTLAAWGGDIQWIQEASKANGVFIPKIRRGIDLKGVGMLMRAAIGGAQAKRGGLVSTMKAFGLGFEGRQHDALADAYNTAVLARRWVKVVRTHRALLDVLDEK
jgi:DNA polymerase III alpha subunit (gram-positive type)